MKIAMMLRPYPEPAWRLAKQAGVDYAVTNLSHLPLEQPLTFETLSNLKGLFGRFGLDLCAIESDPFPLNRIKEGLPGRDEDIERYCKLLKMMGDLGIPLMCYNFMARVGWLRTSVDTPTRGGALATSFDYDLVRRAPDQRTPVIEESRLWDNLCYFLERVVPVAEKAGVKLALHPDDPPVSPVMGVGRILTSVEAVSRVLEMFPSPCHGVAFCQGTFALMEGDLYEAICRFGRRGKIFFVHFRNVKGTPERFEETFHDAGQIDMVKAIRCYREIGFDGPIRPDHAPTMEGESNDRPGYAVTGRIFAVGYIKGLLECVGRGCHEGG